jgi:hypothetical protein
MLLTEQAIRLAIAFLDMLGIIVAVEVFARKGLFGSMEAAKQKENTALGLLILMEL